MPYNYAIYRAYSQRPDVRSRRRIYTRMYNHQPNQLIKRRQRRFLQKTLVIAILGGKCELCGCSNPLMLTLDHRHGDGGIHRKLLKTTSLYAVVLKEGCPTTRYRLLCGSCNLAVAAYGEPAVVASIKQERSV